MEKRTVLWYMTFWGFAINYMFRMNINIAIVSMIKHSISQNNVTVVQYECLRHTESLTSNITLAQISLADQNENKFEWNEYQQNSILGAFFALHVIMQLPGGILAQRYGTKTVFGISNGVAAILSFAVPASAKFNYKALVVVRAVQGLIAGGAWPSMHTMTANWIPPHERSRFVSAYLGSSIGTAVTYIMCGYLIASFGWESVFYVSGGLGLLWFICWILLVYDTPAKHPTISIRERTYIENCIGKTIQTRSKPLPIPWKSLLLSKALMVNLVTQTGGIWGLFTLAAQAPSYFNFVLGLNIKQTGLWSGMPHIIRWAFSFGFSTICDRLVKSKRMSMTNVRKIATVFCNILQGLFIMGLCYSGCNSVVAVIMLFSATAVNGAISSGALASVVDIAPNYAGVIQGIIGTVSTSSGFISPIIVGYLTLNQQTLSQWCKVFNLSGAICICTGLIYIFFGTSDIQKWNTYNDPVVDEKELKSIVKKSNSSYSVDT
ncbi:sialin-like [Myzus persicae]|uniref:sialin-like n=1 Tax=Myzus persicae TaxID=13164 RepID=UPI000B936FF2|nr:sialin-like [Myzus persicae]